MRNCMKENRANGVAAVPVADADLHYADSNTPAPAETRPSSFPLTSPFFVFVSLCDLTSGQKYPVEFLTDVYNEQQRWNSGVYRLAVALADRINAERAAAPPSA